MHRTPYRTLATKYKLSINAIKKHSSNGHVLRPIVNRRKEEDLAQGRKLEDTLQEILSFSFESAREARDCRSFNAIGPIIANCHRACEIMVKLEEMAGTETPTGIYDYIKDRRKNPDVKPRVGPKP